MWYYLGLVPYFLFLWIMQLVTRAYGKEWHDAPSQGGWRFELFGASCWTEWLDGRASAVISNNTFGIFAEDNYGERTFAISQYVVW